MNCIQAIIVLGIAGTANSSGAEVSQLIGLIVCIIAIVAFCYSYVFRNKREVGEASKYDVINTKINKEEKNERAKQQDE